MQGYLILFNCKTGRQTEKQISGQVYLTNFPRPKRIFDKNSITIMSNGNHVLIDLEVPSNDYSIGQVFNKRMIKGSLGILYSPD